MIFRYLKLFWRKLVIRKPYQFRFIKEEEGCPVGPELQVVHPTFHDMSTYFCRCRLTEEVILTGIDADAILYKETKMISDVMGITTFQPCKIT